MHNLCRLGKPRFKHHKFFTEKDLLFDPLLIHACILFVKCKYCIPVSPFIVSSFIYRDNIDAKFSPSPSASLTLTILIKRLVSRSPVEFKCRFEELCEFNVLHDEVGEGHTIAKVRIFQRIDDLLHVKEDEFYG
jgi:hypothetical protein